MSIVFPAEKTAWNGKLFVTVHGRGESFKEGTLKTWNRYLNPADPLADLNKYDRLMVAKGYALVKTHRTSAEGLGEIKTVLEDGSTVDYAAFNDTVRYISDFTELARRLVAERLGSSPRRIYIYGHSAGARIGHDIDYSKGLNADRDGKRLFDGILADDAAAGTWLPVLMHDGKDVLLQTTQDKDAFVPMLDISHQMYNAIWAHQMPDYMTDSYLANKRRNAEILLAKGLAPAKERMYEVRSISHMGGETEFGEKDGPVHILDLSRMMDRFIDILDAWVEKGTDPPPSRSDWAPLGDANQDGVIEHPALTFPEVACPTGVYFPWPQSGGYQTSFAPFTGGRDLEPLDSKKVFVDMNRNGVWDFRESVADAWRRLGLLKAGELLTQEKYTACVQRAAEGLRRDGFFSEQTVREYVEHARATDLSLSSAKHKH
jgi:hypothetical protein